MNYQMRKWADAPMNRWADEQICRWADMQMSRSKDQQMRSWSDEQISRYSDEQMNRWADTQMSRWANTQMSRWADELMLMLMLAVTPESSKRKSIPSSHGRSFLLWWHILWRSRTWGTFMSYDCVVNILRSPQQRSSWDDQETSVLVKKQPPH